MKLRKIHLKKGEILFKEGDTNKAMYYIVSGSIDVVAKNLHRNKKSNVNVLKRGDLIGELSFFDGKPRSATLIAHEDTEALVIDKKFFDGIHTDHVKIIQAMVKKIRSLNDKILELQDKIDELSLIE
jgi:CRP/FNR family cyclic AMP-dependent transcriptional regulator